MKRVILFTAAVALTASVYAQKSKTKMKAKGGASASATSGVALKSTNDSISYAFGFSIAQYMKNQGVTSINYAVLNKAIQQTLSGEKGLMDQSQCQAVMQNMQQEGAKVQQKKAEQVAAVEKEKGRKFLEENKKRPGVVETASGLQYEIITKGNGPTATKQDTVVAHYKGTLLDGKEFDNSRNHPGAEPLTIPVGAVIPGWTEALTLMPVGSKWKLYIPSSLGYGDFGAGGGEIPGGATLIFEVELLEVKPKK